MAAAAFYEATAGGQGFKDKWGNWYATGDLLKGARRVPTPFPAPPWFDAWFDSLIADPVWDLTKPFRNRQLHQIQSRSVTIHVPTITGRVHVGGTPRPAPAATPTARSVEQFGPTVTSTGLAVNEHYDEVSDFTLRHWTSFWRHF